MFRRLLFSYVLVIGTVLLIIAVALPLVLGRLRDQVTFSQLQLAGRLVEVETGRFQRQGGDAARIGRVLIALAENQDRRFLLVEPQNRRVLFDTAPEPNWVGQSFPWPTSHGSLIVFPGGAGAGTQSTGGKALWSGPGDYERIGGGASGPDHSA
jgi:hypothetical protein